MYIKLSVVYDKPKAGQNKNEGKFRGKKGGGGKDGRAMSSRLMIAKHRRKVMFDA